MALNKRRRFRRITILLVPLARNFRRHPTHSTYLPNLLLPSRRAAGVVRAFPGNQDVELYL